MSEKINIVDLYRTCTELSKQIEIQFTKKEKVSESLLNLLSDSFLKIIEFEKTYLILGNDTFYGSMLMSLETEINFKINAPIGIDVSSEPFVMTFNPLRCYSYSFPQFTGLVVGEILKLAFGHPESYAELNSVKDNAIHELLEKASEATVSSLIQNDIQLDSETKGLRLPKNMYTIAMMNNDCTITPKRNETIEYYYSVLKNFSKKNNGQQQTSSGQSKIGRAHV